MADISDKQLQYLYSAIADVQGAVRALDTKTNYLMVILTIPFLKLGQIGQKCATLYNFQYPAANTVATLMIIALGATWLLAILASYKTLIAIDNPAVHIKDGAKSTFYYSGALFSPGIIDTFINRPKLHSSVNLDAHQQALPQDDDDLRRQLVTEHVKLVYIRSMKIIRSQWAYRFSAAWAIIGSIIWAFSLMKP